MTQQEILDRLMPQAFNLEKDSYKKLISDAENNGGAIATELQTLANFRDYYTKTISVDEAEGILLDNIAELFAGLTRNFDEDDAYFRLRYKSLVTRHGYGPRAIKEAFKQAYSYFFDEDKIYILENYPTTNLLKNGSFDTMSSDWAYSGQDVALAYSKSFDGTALKLLPAIAGSVCSVSQTVTIPKMATYSFAFFFSSTKKGAGSLGLTIYHTGTKKYYNIDTGTWSTTKVSKQYSVNDGTPGAYTMVHLFLPLTSGNVQLQFSTISAAGFLLDAVAIGPIEWPNVRAILVTDPEVFYNQTIQHDNKVTHNGFYKFYILDGIGMIMDTTHAAGVRGEYYLLSDRMNYPWDRVTISEGYSIDLSVLNYTSKIVHNNLKLHNATGALIEADTRSIQKNYSCRGTQPIYHNSRIGYDTRFSHAGIIYGINIGYSQLTASKWQNIVSHTQIVYNNSALHDESILHDGVVSVTTRQLVATAL
jgi:hypothetical protein